MFANLAYYYICIVNDIKHLHTHVSGRKFFRLHETLDEYYERMSDESDTIQELALEYNERLQNPNLACDLILYNYTNMERYGFTEAAKKTFELLNLLYKLLLDVSSKCEDKPDVKNQLEEFMRFWHKEANYKIKRWLEEGE